MHSHQGFGFSTLLLPLYLGCHPVLTSLGVKFHRAQWHPWQPKQREVTATRICPVCPSVHLEGYLRQEAVGQSFSGFSVCCLPLPFDNGGEVRVVEKKSLQGIGQAQC